MTFWRKNIGAKAARKMLMKLTKVEKNGKQTTTTWLWNRFEF